MKNKYIKFLIILNGTLLPILLFFLLFQITKDFFKSKENYRNEGVIVGEVLEEAKKDSVALQGLRYHTPNSLYNSNNMYLPISLLTYEEEKTLNKFVSTANDFNQTLLKYVNVIFIDENYQVIKSLVNKKASISEIKSQEKSNGYNNNELDTSVKYLAYKIAFEDSNNDGKLNSNDDHDLYLSDLNGNNLKKITEDIEVQSFNFINNNSQIRLYYVERNEIREEHKKRKIAIYNIEQEKLIKLSSLDNELDKLEKLIIQ